MTLDERVALYERDLDLYERVHNARWPLPVETPFSAAMDEPGIGPVERTRRIVATRPELRDHLAFNYWRTHDRVYCYGSGASGVRAFAVWEAMPDDERNAHIARAMAALEAFWRRVDGEPDPGGPGEPLPAPAVEPAPLRRTA